MIERRDRPRRRILKSGKIIVSDNAPKIECTVRNLTDDGACLHVSTTFGIPARFDLDFENVRKTCRVVWVKDTQMGVMFV